MLRLRLVFLIPLVVTGCNRDAGTGQTDAAMPYTSDVIGIEESYLSADYWVARASSAQSVVKDRASIDAFNERSFAGERTMADLATYAERLSGPEVREIVRAISRRPSVDLFREDGNPLEDIDFERYERSLNLDGLADVVETRYGLIVERTDMRTFPTRDRVYNTAQPSDLDRFQEHGLFPGEGVAVLHRSADDRWLFVQSYNYAAWIEAASVAWTDKSIMLKYLSAPEFLVVTGNKVDTTFNPQLPAVSELQLDMGVRLPLVRPASAGHDIHGQNPFASYIVRLPIRTENGTLQFELALIPRNRDVSVGYLPYTPENLIRQSFKFLGERYGWGHSYNGRDSTGFVSEIYKTFGIFMPRNSGDQGRSVIGRNRRFSDESTAAEKSDALRKLTPGSLIYIPGHVMMHLGDIDGRPYVIHDVYGLGYTTPEGNFYRGVLAGVSVTPLLPMRLSEATSYVDRIYNIKVLR